MKSLTAVGLRAKSAATNIETIQVSEDGQEQRQSMSINN